MLNLLTIPSIASHTMSGGFLLLALGLVAMNFKTVTHLPLLQLLLLVLVASIAVGIHGLSHLGVEREYGYNPWKLLGY
jgi:hypothetical protein